MAICNPELLHVAAYRNGFTLWHYIMRHGQTFSDIEDDDGKSNVAYFAPIAGVIKVDDVIAVDGEDVVGVSRTIQLYQVLQVTESVMHPDPGAPACVLVEFVYAPRTPKEE